MVSLVEKESPRNEKEVCALRRKIPTYLRFYLVATGYDIKPRRYGSIIAIPSERKYSESHSLRKSTEDYELG